MALTAEALARAGVSQSPEQIERLLLEAIERVVGQATDPRRELSAGEAAALEQGGVRLEAEAGWEEPYLWTATEYAALLATSLTVAEAADVLGVHPSRIRQRLSEKTLYGTRDRGVWRLPRFQLEGNGVLPGWAMVLPRVPESVHPVALFRWLTTPDPDLAIGESERALSPREWLRRGLDPVVVGDLAAEL